MRKIIYLLMLGLIPMLASCDKELNVKLKQSGSLTIKAVDNDGKGIDNAKISLVMHGETFIDDSTDASGIYKTGELLENMYTLSVSVKKGKLTYSDRRPIQVISGEEKYVEMAPFKNSGKITLHLYKNSPDKPIASANVVICPNTIANSVDEYIEMAYLKGKLNDKGVIFFEEIPFNSSYRAVFYDNNKKILVNRSFDTYDAAGSADFYFRMYTSSVSISVLNGYSYEPIASLNVLMLPSNVYSNSLEECKAKALFNKTTNSDGVAVFDEVLYEKNDYYPTNYRFLVYNRRNNVVLSENYYEVYHSSHTYDMFVYR